MSVIGIIWTLIFLGVAWVFFRLDGTMYQVAAWLFCLMAAGSLMYMLKGEK
jgi:hypothetical protein